MAEVLLTKTGLGRTTILSGLVAMSALKAAAVAAFYMHLRWERIWLTALALTPFVFTTLFAVVLILENGR
ncbi:MAG: cytochrome C oxidase subunit IV family protein [Candidatus Wallbacteria bacterium]|nr:cytochrome C oxidase subunit IV family protein [Candidatus Wallbacteria bacterium]